MRKISATQKQALLLVTLTKKKKDGGVGQNTEF